jgi:hypothetical protein
MLLYVIIVFLLQTDNSWQEQEMLNKTSDIATCTYLLEAQQFGSGDLQQHTWVACCDEQTNALTEQHEWESAAGAGASSSRGRTAIPYPSYGHLDSNANAGRLDRCSVRHL